MKLFKYILLFLIVILLQGKVNAKPSGLTRGLSPIPKYFDDLDYYLTHFTNKSGANDLNHWVLGKGVNTPTVTVNNWSEVNQTLDYLKKNQIHTKTDIEFGKKFQSTAGNSSRKSDLYYKDGNNVFHKEFKNAQITSLSDQRVGQVVGQYGAFSKINNLNEYEWIAILGKNDGKLGDIKTFWKNAFIDSADDMFKPINQGGLGQAKINQLFKLDGMNDIVDADQFILFMNTNTNFRNNALKFIKVE